MTDKKIYIIEWNGADLKNGADGTKNRYEKFKVIAGSEKEELNFYSKFFISDNKFKKGEVYELSTLGNFIQDSTEIIEGIDNGGHEFEKVTPSLMIQELWEEKQGYMEKLCLLEAELQSKKEDLTRKNEELSSKERDFTNLQSRFNNLQLEKDESVKKLNISEETLKKERENSESTNQKLTNYEAEVEQLKGQVNIFKDERRKIETDWANPEEKSRILNEKENLNSQLRKEKRERQKALNLLEDLRSQGLNKTIYTKLEESKKELEHLKAKIIENLGNDQKFLLGNFLEKQEDFDIALFDDSSQTGRVFLRAKEKLQDARDKLINKISSEEFEELCKMQNEISKLETSQSKWEKMEEQQQKEEQEQFESFISTPPTTPRNN